MAACRYTCDGCNRAVPRAMWEDDQYWTTESHGGREESASRSFARGERRRPGRDRALAIGRTPFRRRQPAPRAHRGPCLRPAESSTRGREPAGVPWFILRRMTAAEPLPRSIRCVCV